MLGRPLGRLRAGGAGHPYRRVGLLDGHHPGIDHPEVVVLALPAEGAGGGPGLDDQVVALLEPLPVVDGIAVGGQGLDPCSPHHAGYDPAAGDDVDHGDLFGKADRVLVDGQDVAQQQDPGVLGDAGQDGGGQVARGVHAGRGVVVLVDHDPVEAHLIHVHALVEVPLEQAVGSIRVEVGVGKGQPQGGILLPLLIRVLVIGKLAEVINFHRVVASFGSCHQLSNRVVYLKLEDPSGSFHLEQHCSQILLEMSHKELGVTNEPSCIIRGVHNEPVGQRTKIVEPCPVRMLWCCMHNVPCLPTPDGTFT